MTIRGGIHFIDKKLVVKAAFILLFSLFLFGFTTTLLVTNVLSDEAEELEQQLEETEAQKKLKEDILAETQSELDTILNSSWSLSQKIAAIEDQIAELEADITGTEADIALKEENINAHEKKISQKEIQVEEISRRLYKNSRLDLLEFFVKTEVSNDFIRSYILKKYTLNKQVGSIEELNLELGDLQTKKEVLDEEKTRLEAENEALDGSRIILAEEKKRLQEQVAAATAARGQLQNEISLLNNRISELQRAILIARSGSYVPSVGSVPTGADFNASAEGFRQNAPAGTFAVFSFGAYTHRLGMSQYGAKGRAESGQDRNTIIKAYYGTLPVSRNTDGQIKVEGYGDMDFETTYLYGIAEMPHTWPSAALEAQAIVARAYAYRYKSEGKTICTTQSCQVFLKSKSDNPPAEWKSAVDATRGVIVEGVTTFYSATSGGFLTTSGWDTTDGVGGGTWTERAYESIGGSPWLYKAWYRNGLNMNASSCGRFPWMTQTEMADILNTYLVMKRNGVVGNVDDARILPVTLSSCPYAGGSGNPYSMDEMKGLLASPVTEIYGYPQVNFNIGAGQTASVSFSTNRGVVTIGGMDFKSTFNARAPGYLSIPQSSWSTDFAHFNVERK